MTIDKHQTISCIDIETTGLNRTVDRIIQLSVTNFQLNEQNEPVILESKNWYILPSGYWTITPDAYYIHNISEDFIRENGVSIKSIYDDFMKTIQNHPILTYNGATFDISFIQREFEREMLETGFQDHQYIDSYDIEKKLNSNKLTDVYRRYYGEDFEDAHDSSADVMATIRVFAAQVRSHDHTTEETTSIIDESIEATTKNMQTSPEGFVYVDDNNVLKFKSGKFKEYPVVDVCQNNPSYIKWLFTPNNGDNVITSITKSSIKKEYYKDK